jgi:hypothetical protein
LGRDRETGNPEHPIGLCYFDSHLLALLLPRPMPHLIIFLSDHGEMLGDRFHRFNKYCLYEGSIRVPMIIAGAGVPEEKQGTWMTDTRNW